MTIDYSQAREMMVEQQVRPWDVLDVRVLSVLATLPRETFVPEIHRALAFGDLLFSVWFWDILFIFVLLWVFVV